MKSYCIKTFGCQMNKHDSERIAGMLNAQGLLSVETPEEADVVVFMTCCVRENADERLRGQVASLKALKTGGRPDVLIAVGGCIGQRDGEKLLTQLPHIDVVFGTHNVGNLPTLLELADKQKTKQVEILTETLDFAADLPAEREHDYHAWLPIMVGCDNFCTYCIVPYVRGRERSRTLEDITAQAQELVAQGVREITLLGQNVNSYGRDIYGDERFAEVLRAVAGTGVSRLGFATSHPKDLSDDTIAAMVELPAVLNYLHLPFQSGSSKVLEAMNRGYTKEEYLALVNRIYDAMPDIALSTDIIVGFPGETEEDFLDTLDVVKKARFDSAFTFIYSPREGTPAATMDDQVDRAVSQERFDRLVEVVQAQALENSLRMLDTVQEVLIEGPSKRNEDVLTGRARNYKVVHCPVPAGSDPQEWAGREVRVNIDHAQTWFVSGEMIDD